MGRHAGGGMVVSMKAQKMAWEVRPVGLWAVHCATIRHHACRRV